MGSLHRRKCSFRTQSSLHRQFTCCHGRHASWEARWLFRWWERGILAHHRCSRRRPWHCPQYVNRNSKKKLRWRKASFGPACANHQIGPQPLAKCTTDRGWDKKHPRRSLSWRHISATETTQESSRGSKKRWRNTPSSFRRSHKTLN